MYKSRRREDQVFVSLRHSTHKVWPNRPLAILIGSENYAQEAFFGRVRTLDIIEIMYIVLTLHRVCLCILSVYWYELLALLKVLVCICQKEAFVFRDVYVFI